MTKIEVQYNVSYDDAIKQTIDCKCCGETEKPNLRRDFQLGGSHWYLDDDSVRRRNAGVCSNCDFWLDKWRMRDEENVVRVNGQHYMYGNHLQDARITQDDTLETLAKTLKKSNGLGMGGDQLIIRFNDGRTVITNDLWHQGNIPSLFEHLMPNNAVMERVS